MRPLLRAFTKPICFAVFGFIFSVSLGYMLGTLRMFELSQEKAQLIDKVNQVELELFESERQIAHCDEELGHKMNALLTDTNPKYIYVITPTYTRKTQRAELNLLSNSLKHIPYLQWIVVEVKKTALVKEFLEATNLNYVHLDADGKKLLSGGNICNNLRNLALDHLTEYKNSTGVIIFANLDRTYDPVLFEEVRKVAKVGIWPVTLADQTFQCHPKLSFPENNEDEYPLNIGSVAMTTEVLYQRLRFDPKLSDTTALSLILDKFVTSKDDIETMFCDKEVVWFTSIF